ncbi:Na+/H+ antiporter NhaA [Hymenobacter chitinivorans]|uniref:Na(+)/H(+) antiporter NhaA n=1 Tax=Hymenobacter chitinivorans DSM 11115 TaxID=1121954 RepID=A0A2M9BT90_9BACT|nr:Na+/H+ antiporter NhaA [Hymenobacter chitinivorans]PJJ61147.1 NhaA family Na+:H+ antiporter [Hymenobacter chitinivorans DSM 11115]
MPLRKILVPIRELSESGKLSGLLLLLATVVSLLVSNSVLGPNYLHFWETPLGWAPLQKTLAHWVDDGLMVVFFFSVGLEIKREVLYGELTDVRQALLPILAAVGGVAVPAGIYLAFNAGTATGHGWAVPTATDIAFSLGILSLLGEKVPPGLRVFLTALAIIDDLIAVLIIALFYTQGLDLTYLLAAGGIMAVLVLLNRLRVTWLPLYFLLGLALWFFVLKSGIHATIAGVLLALTIPTDAIEKLEAALHKPISYLILPVFALANTAIVVSAGAVSELLSPLGLGVALGLLLGKPLGIFGATWLTVKAGISALPERVTWFKMLGLGLTAGIGFTMAIFIANLSFHDPGRVDVAKLAVILGSLLAALAGLFVLHLADKADDSEAPVGPTESEIEV